MVKDDQNMWHAVLVLINLDGHKKFSTNLPVLKLSVLLKVMIQEFEYWTIWLCSQVALQVGLDASRIKLAVRRKIEQTGVPFTTPDALIEAVLRIQMNEETGDTASSSTSSREASPAQSAHADSEEEGQQPVPQR